MTAPAIEPLPEPFLEHEHQALRLDLRRVLEEPIQAVQSGFERGELDEDAAARAFVRVLSAEGLLARALGGDARALCLAREEIAFQSAFADNQLALQGLGSQPIVLFGSAAQKEEFARAAFEGRRVAAFALTEDDAGSDVHSMATTARRDGDHWVLDGSKTLITNAGVADFATVFARREEGGGERRRFEAFVVPADTPGFEVVERFEVTAPHPIGRLRLHGCRVPESQRLGPEGSGMAAALGTLERFRASVGAAALGMAWRALEECRTHVLGRRQFGRPLANFQLVRAQVAQMWAELETERLAVYRAAWTFDRSTAGGPGSGAAGRRVRQSVSSMAKWGATEAAHRIVDRAVQLFGGRGVLRGEPAERLLREVRALRIYEGTSEIQSLILARELLGDEA